MTQVLVPTTSVPPWMRGLIANLDGVTRSVEDRGGVTARLMRAMTSSPRPAAVLVLFSGDWSGEVARSFGYEKERAELFVIGKDGRVALRQAGAANEAALAQVFDAVDRLRGAR